MTTFLLICEPDFKRVCTWIFPDHDLLFYSIKGALTTFILVIIYNLS